MAVKYKDTGRACGYCHSGTFVLYGGEGTAKCRYCGVIDGPQDEPPKRSISPSNTTKPLGRGTQTPASASATTAKKAANG